MGKPARFYEDQKTCQTFFYTAAKIEIRHWVSAPADHPRFFTISTLLVIRLRSKSRVYSGLPCSPAQALNPLAEPWAVCASGG